MPGVPSGKGCDACRKQKKKCDQAKPNCSRCSRLGITCVGSGKQRYKFKVEILDAHDTQEIIRATPDRKLAKAKSKSKKLCVQFHPLVMVPNSRTTALSLFLISRLEVTDPRYDINVYGSFLKRIPERIGINDALDASIDAFTTASTALTTQEPGLDVLCKYGYALRSVRNCLNDPKKGPTAETMCAIYLIMVIQGWIGTVQQSAPSHAEGLAYLLKATSNMRWDGLFEIEMIITMCVPVILESITNPRLKLNPWFWKILDNFRMPTGPEHPDYTEMMAQNPDVFPSLTLQSLSRLPEYIKNPELYQLDILSAYHLLLIDSKKLRMKLDYVSQDDLAARPGVSMERVKHAFKVAYTMALGLVLLVNSILQPFDPSDITLIKESTSCVDEVVKLAEDGLSLRPLGSSHIPVCLAIAWAVTKNQSLEDRMTAMLVDYRKDFKNPDWVATARWWRNKFESIAIRLKNYKNNQLPEDAWTTPEPELEVGDGDCAVQ